jgi:hypothetical protein
MKAHNPTVERTETANCTVPPLTFKRCASEPYKVTQWTSQV